MPKTYFITGAAGFIGSHVCERLLRRGDRVIGFDNLDPFYPRIVKEQNLKFLETLGDFRFFAGDIRLPEDLDEAVKEQGKIHAIGHLAARPGVPNSILNPTECMEINVQGATQVFELARRARTEVCVVASSSSVYGNQKKMPFEETDPVDRPISPYGVSKRACELLAYTYHLNFKIPFTVVRPFSIYGPRGRPDMVIYKFAWRMREGKKLPIWGDGSQRRDFTFVGDFVDGFVAALDKPLGFEIINLGENRQVVLNDLIAVLETELDVKALKEFQQVREWDIPASWASVEKAGRLLGYQPKTEIHQGIKIFCDWFKTLKEPVRM